MAQQAGPKAHNTEVIFYSWWTGLGGAGIDDLLVINITFRHTNACERTENNARCRTSRLRPVTSGNHLEKGESGDHKGHWAHL